MAIDPVFSSSSAAEQSPQRSRAPDTPRGGQDFTLPEAQADKRPAPQDKSAVAQDPSAPTDAKAPDAGKGDQPAADAKSPGTAAPKPAESSSALPAAATAGQSVSGQKPQRPATDIGAIASILAAAEEAKGKGAGTPAEPAAEVAEEGAVPVPVKPGKKKTGDDAEAAAATPEPVSASAQAVATVVAAPDLAILLGTGVAAIEGQTGAEKGEAGAVSVVADTRGASAAIFQQIGTATPGIPVEGEQAVGEAGKGEDKAGSLPAAQLAAKGHAAPEAAAPIKTDSDLAALMQPNGQPVQAEAKQPENLQQALTPIDLSAMVAQASARPAAAHPQAAAILDPASAQGQPAPQAQGNGLSMPTPLHVVPIEIGMRALAGARSFDIRLDPAELGRVDVNLSISDKGEVSAKLVVDRVETLHLLQRDARTLERAFEQAGLKPSDSGVDITLRDNSGQSFRQQRQQDEAPQRQRHASQTDEIETIGSVAAVATQPSRQIVRLGGVDLSI